MANIIQPDANEAPEVIFISINKNKGFVSINSYVYQNNKSSPKVSYWICKHKSRWTRIHLDKNDRFIKFTKSHHTHMPVPQRVEIRRLMMNVKNLSHN